MSKKLLDVILLKSNDENESNTVISTGNVSTKKDRYINALEQQRPHLIATSQQINLLKFSYVNSHEIYMRLKNCLSNENTHAHKCLIITSRQAIESIQMAFNDRILNKLNNKEIEESDFIFKERIDEYDMDKIRLVVYCVGEVTKTRFKQFVRDTLFKYEDSNILEHVMIRTPSSSTSGGHKQNAKSLANLIVDDYNFLKLKYSNNSLFTSTGNKYALYPCSSIRKDDLSNELRKNLISLEEIVAYETVADDLAVMRLNSHLDSYLATCNNNDNEDESGNSRVCCLVFFSPSGCDAVFNKNNSEKILGNMSGNFLFISIGPSTSVKLKEFVNESLVHELSEPSPDALVEKLKALFLQ